MLKKTITYTDFDDTVRTEDFYFNLTESELTEWNLSQEGGMKYVLDRISQEQNIPKLSAFFKEIITRAYGEKSADGRRFVKSPELSNEFTQTMAYDALYVELIQNSDYAAEFIKQIIPPKFREASADNNSITMNKTE